MAAKIPDKLSKVSNARKRKKVVESMKYEFVDFLLYIPNFVHQFIANIINVKGDGNYDFRCVAGDM